MSPLEKAGPGKMTVIKKNIAANFAGNIWQVLMSLAFVPLYIKFMGVESYGLIGIFATFQGVFVILDMGLGSTMTREMARLSVLPDRKQEMRDLVRSLEVVYWGVAAFIGIVVVVMAPFIAHHWVKASKLSPAIIEQALKILGFAMALQWPAALYSGGLMGLQKQVLQNMISSGMSTLRGVGAVLILWLLSPTIKAFFLWQIVVSLISTFVLYLFLWRSLPRVENKASFDTKHLVRVWRFAASMSGISILATILTQVDKVILSKMLTLEMFGYYTLAGLVAMTVYRFTGPVFTAVYPKFTQLAAIPDQEGLVILYHKSCQLMSVLIIPFTVVVSMFSYEIMLLWTRNPVTAENCHLLVTLMIIGTALTGLMNIPYALQLAHGWTKLSIYVNLFSVVFLVPLIIYLSRHYGAVGGASVWVILNTAYIFTTIPIMHKYLLPHENWRWYWQDVFIPLATSLLVAGTGRLFLVKSLPKLEMALYLAFVSIATLFMTAMSTDSTKKWVLDQFLKFRPANS